MKTRKSIIASVWILLAVFVMSCNDGSETPASPQDQNVVAQNILVNSNAALNRLRSTGIGGPMGAAFGNAQGRSGRSDMQPSDMIKKSTRDANDSTEFVSCLVETWEEDGAGNYVLTLDFGDGCDYFGEWLKGKLVERGFYDENSFNSTTTFTNFGGHDWTIDGTESYSGTWEEFIEDEDEIDEEEDEDFEYAASFQFAADLKSSYMEYGYDSASDVSTGEQLIEVLYVAEGAEEINESGFTITSRTESVDVSTGESFTTQVDAPLFYNFDCDEEDVWIFVSGQESGTYTVEGQSGTYSIDYGDGSCDNIITITENGISEEVDLGEEWDEWEEECGSED